MSQSTDTDIERIEAEPVNANRNRAPLYAPRKKIYPKRASGTYRRFKWIIMALTLGIYYITPWLRWDRGPYAPDQAVLVDLANRRFYFFFIEIWPQEFIYIAILLVMAGIGLFLITTTVGRAWCGYTCPQTVWVDLFLVIERWVEGDRNARIKLEAAPWSASKLVKRSVKHAIWILIGVLTGGAWIFYFADAPTLLIDLLTGNAAIVAYSTVAILTATTYVFGGLMREQVCTYMCPWPRIQAAMLDEHSLTVTYNDWRGEPRSRHSKRAASQGETVGDCVDCNACVAVCPMGIDIREGQQLECITCALCIDACDTVMDKTGKERGLISYATWADYTHNVALATEDGTAPIDPKRVYTADGKLSPKVAKFHFGKLLRPRNVAYFSIWSLAGLALVFTLVTRSRLDINVLHDRNPQFVVLSDGSIRNGYTVKLLNMIPQPRTATLALNGLEGGVMSIPTLNIEGATEAVIDLQPDRLREIQVFIRQDNAPVGADARQPFSFIVTEGETGESATYNATFITPEGAR